MKVIRESVLYIHLLCSLKPCMKVKQFTVVVSLEREVKTSTFVTWNALAQKRTSLHVHITMLQ